MVVHSGSANAAPDPGYLMRPGTWFLVRAGFELEKEKMKLDRTIAAVGCLEPRLCILRVTWSVRWHLSSRALNGAASGHIAQH